jgi:poly-gamma-glutamate capsule biosynthesis protein CapA/YwtB (metallophosphatase superfamily)
MRLVFVGDVMLGRLVNESLRRELPAYPWGDTLALLWDADLRLCNLECALSDRGAPWTATPKIFHFRSDARNSAVLRAGRVDAVALANNHALDYGHEALVDTLTLLDAARVYHAGAGRNIEEAAAPAIILTPEGRIGLLAFTDNEPAWEATVDRPGVLWVPVDLEDARARRLLERVRHARAAVDFLIVSAHWGPNWGHVPPREHLSFGHALIDAGADIVFGHSAHVPRGIEIAQQRPILYSAGDFIDDYAVDPVERNDESCIFALETQRHHPHHLRLYPTVIADCQARLARGDRAHDIAARLRRLCADLGTVATWHAAGGYLEFVFPAAGEDPPLPAAEVPDGERRTE